MMNFETVLHNPQLGTIKFYSMTLFELLLLSLLHAACSSVVVEPWGRDSLRVRVAPGGAAPRADLYTALLDTPTPQLLLQEPTKPIFENNMNKNGNLKVVTTSRSGARQFIRISDGKVLLTEESTVFFPPISAFHSEPQFISTFSMGDGVSECYCYLSDTNHHPSVQAASIPALC